MIFKSFKKATNYDKFEDIEDGTMFYIISNPTRGPFIKIAPLCPSRDGSGTAFGIRSNSIQNFTGKEFVKKVEYKLEVEDFE